MFCEKQFISSIQFAIFEKKNMKYLVLLIFLGFYQLQAQSYLDFYFKANNIDGGIVIYNQNKEEWLFNTESEAFTNTPIASHFHLWQALVGLEHKIITTGVHDKQLWDGVKRTFFGEPKPEWNFSSNLIDALKHKNDWYFERLKAHLPKDIYEKQIVNAPLHKEIKNNEWPYFWNYGVLTNPNTLILFLKDLHETKLPFAKKSQQFVFNHLLLNEHLAVNTVKTHYDGQVIEWTLGVYLKQNKPIYFSYRTRRSLEAKVEEDYEYRRNLVLAQIFEVLNY